MQTGTYVDTGILVKTCVKETTSPEAVALVLRTSSPLPLTHFQELEIRNAIRLKHSRGELSAANMTAALADFQDDIDEGRYERPAYDLPAVFRRAEELSKAHAVATKCRSLDLLHVAAALVIGSLEFASFDERQRAVARKAGLTVVPARLPRTVV
ncbi:MAG: type II toxin-antitoxin system VapC family toxin [Opitutaceae bacterium]|jgi:predicted nucleic acid-binding protein|nr:type II toxin-antitoxin system VapC family toxin [Opitutaceae bacterium]